MILHHTRYIVRDGRYTKLIFYYFDDHKDTLDKASKRVLKYMKLDDLFSFRILGHFAQIKFNHVLNVSSMKIH